jgi:hypothetical protein
MSTFMPLPTARRAVPIAAVVLPLPGRALIFWNKRSNFSVISYFALSRRGEALLLRLLFSGTS